MAATTMQDTSSIFNQVVSDYPDITFSPGKHFYWRAEDNTVYHPKITTMDDLYLLLHEVGHAQLNHTGYSRDIHLLDMEREAWQHAISTLIPRYRLDKEVVTEISEEALDSYRDWLHKRSTCPGCSAIGIESSKNHYRCLMCEQMWQVNEARDCQLRRYKK